MSKSYLNMSDEEILKQGVPDMHDEQGEPVPVEAENTFENAETNSDSVAEAEATNQEEKQEADATDEDTGTVAKSGSEAVQGDSKEVADLDNKTELEKIDYEAAYKRLTTPFKANGRDIQVASVDDAISLMQMGANYNKKMAGLKPSLKLMKLLENNGLLDESKISYLIELDKKSPDAINKLVKDSGIDPMDFDAEKAGEYKPKIHTVDERAMELDTVLDEIQDTKTYARTLNVVSKEWDGASKQTIADAPQLLKVINSHIESGIYDQISAEVDRERVFGRLGGLSDIEAYRQVGDAIQARGGFNHVGSSQGKSSRAGEVVTPKLSKVDEDRLKEKRRAASSTKPAVTGSAAKDFNPLALSDEEFSKLAESRYR